MADAGSKRGVRAIVIVAVVAALAAFAALLPRGFSEDLSVIGQGRPAAVLVHDRHSVRSQEAMDALAAVRADYAGQLEFLLVASDSVQGRQFVDAHQAHGAALVLLGPDGVRRAVLHDIDGAPALHAALRPLLAAP